RDGISSVHNLVVFADLGPAGDALLGRRRAPSLHARLPVRRCPRDVPRPRTDLVLSDAHRLPPVDRAGEIPIRALVEPDVLPPPDFSKTDLRRCPAFGPASGRVRRAL